MDTQELQDIRDLIDTEVVILGTGEQIEGAVSVEIARNLLDYIDALKAENARMRHDLDTTDGLYASDQEDMSHSFRIQHESLRYKSEV